ncbi:uncharacterized protein LOC112511526 isoform X3 [Cynara cardunculus var. scolymus]|uniref:uncharacterized protein LOC112511526 isoform X3 n=1 Tax=Cynara cardunculus var. scolymus TaxID=59895 RepID=UPI000D6311FA|nr:uncharacterized protein LOC112511526 isoform X3 [Cynara cardunculus var. scolymus]
MGVSFKVSKKGARFRPTPKPESPSVPEDNDPVDDAPQIQPATTRKRAVDVTKDDGDVAENLDAEVSFILNIFPDGYSIGNPSECMVGHQNAVQDDPKCLHPYDRASESLFTSIECGRIPADFLDDIPCKYNNGAIVCEVRDYRKDSSESGVNGPSTVASPTIMKVSLKMSLGNVVKDIPLISDGAWTYGDLMEAESRVLKALQPGLCLDPTPNLDRLCKEPTSLKLNLNIPELRRKRLRQMSGTAPASDNQIQGKASLDRVPENSNFRLEDSRPMIHQPDFVDLATQDVGQSNMIVTRPKNQPDSSIPASSVSHQSKYQTGVVNPRHMQDHVPGTVCTAPGPSSAQDMQRLPQQFTRSNFPQTPWNNMGQPLENNTRKEEHLQRRTVAQSPRISAGGLPQSPLSPKSGEFSSGSMGMQFGAVAIAAVGSSQKEKSVVPLVSAVGTRSVTSSSNDAMQRHHQVQMAANCRSKSLPMTHVISGVGSPSSVGNVSGPFTASSPVGEEVDRSILDRFSKVEMLTMRLQLNCRKINKIDEYKESTTFPTEQLIHYLFNDHDDDTLKDEGWKMPLSMSLLGGNMNICKTRVLKLVQYERLPQGHESMIPKVLTRMILTEKQSDRTVAMHYGELNDRVAPEDWLPTLPNTHIADLLAAQFCSLMLRERFRLQDDHLQLKPLNLVQSSGGQPSSAPGVLAIQESLETVSNQSTNEVATPTNDVINNVAISSPQNTLTARMHPHGNSLSQGGVSMTSIYQQQQQPQQNPHSLLQQQLHRSSATMVTSNPLLNSVGQNSNMQQLGNHMLNKASTHQLQLLQQQQQQQMQRKIMMGSPGNLGIGGQNIGGNHNNHMVGLQGVGNVMAMGGARTGTGNVSPMTTTISAGMGSSNMGQNHPMNMNQAATIGNVISQQLRSGQLTQAQAAAFMATKLRMAQTKPNVLSGPGGQSSNISGSQAASRHIHPGSTGLSMLGSGFNRGNDMNPMQRNVMAPPKMMSGMNLYINQQQQLGSTSQSQHVLSPPQQGGSASIGMTQQMSQPTPVSPQISYMAGQPAMSGGNQEGPASPQLSSQTLGSVGNMANSPM